MIDPGLQGKVVFITGANHGIGAATACAFGLLGAQVFLTAYRSPVSYPSGELEEARRRGIGGALLYTVQQQQPVDLVVDTIRNQGGTAAALEADLSNPANIPMLFDRCEAAFGPVDILVNNHTHCVLETFDPARVTQQAEFPISLVSEEGIDAHFAINTRAYALLMAEYIRRFLQRGARAGRIINVSTDAAHAHEANISYAASKHAIESYSRSAALELGKYGITVNVVAPGPIQTGYLTPEQETQIAASTPLGRVGEPEDVADVIVFLASQQAHWLTGQLLYAGGGWRMPQ
jgi:3-oxoacyl-[acyl-carrier protein] reductase